MQNRVSLFPTLLWLEEIWLVKKLRIDLFQIHEVGDIDGMGGFDPHLLEVFVLQHNITAPPVLEAFHDLVGWNLLCVGLRHLFVPDWTKIAGAKLPKTNFLFARGWINRHRYINQPEADTAFPGRTHRRKPFFHSSLSVSTSEASVPARRNLP